MHGILLISFYRYLRVISSQPFCNTQLLPHQLKGVQIRKFFLSRLSLSFFKLSPISCYTERMACLFSMEWYLCWWRIPLMMQIAHSPLPKHPQIIMFPRLCITDGVRQASTFVWALHLICLVDWWNSYIKATVCAS